MFVFHPHFKEVQKSPRSLERRGLFAFWSVSALKKVKREAAAQRPAEANEKTLFPKRQAV